MDNLKMSVEGYPYYRLIDGEFYNLSNPKRSKGSQMSTTKIERYVARIGDMVIEKEILEGGIQDEYTIAKEFTGVNKRELKKLVDEYVYEVGNSQSH